METNPLTSANPLSSLNPLGRRADTPPWGDATNTNADATVPSDIPNTGVTRKYDFTVTRGEISPDGAVRQVMMVNNQYPGPMIEANWGGMYCSRHPSHDEANVVQIGLKSP